MAVELHVVYVNFFDLKKINVSKHSKEVGGIPILTNFNLSTKNHCYKINNKAFMVFQ